MPQHKRKQTQSFADYGQASQEEREQIVRILQRNVQEIISKKQSKNPGALQELMSDLAGRIRSGETIRGRDFEKLVRLLRKQAVL